MRDRVDEHQGRDLLSLIFFLLIPAVLILILASLPPEFHTWVSSLSQFEKCLIAPFVSFGWQFLLSNLIIYTVVVSALLLIVGREGISRVALQFAVALVAVPVVTGIIKTAVGFQGTALGFSGVVFALIGILTFSLIGDAGAMPPWKALLASLYLIGCAAVCLLVPPSIDIGNGMAFFTDTFGHWCGFVVGAGIAVLLPLRDLRHRWIGYGVLAWLAAKTLPLFL